METKYHTMNKIFLSTWLVLITVSTPVSALDYNPEPTPFRNAEDTTTGDFKYTRTTFLERSSYRIIDDYRQAWDQSRQGYVATVGSTTSDDLLSLMRFYHRPYLAEGLSFNYRFIRAEDFDGVFDQNLIGLNYVWHQPWSISLFGDVIRNKESIDFQFEVEYGAITGNYYRFALLLVDRLFNVKQKQQEYLELPETFFIEFKQHWHSVKVDGYINVNTPLQLLEFSNQETFHYAQHSAGIEMRLPLNSDWALSAQAKGEWGERSWQGVTEATNYRQDFDRYYNDYTLELSQRHKPSGNWLGGLNYFRLTENSTSLVLTELVKFTRRRERTWFFGYRWPYGPQTAFTPTLYLTRLNNRETFPNDQARDTHHTRYIGKIAFPWEWRFQHGARVTINPTMYTHKISFGGLNVQAFIPIN